jgi:N-methylhydantoinase A
VYVSSTQNLDYACYKREDLLGGDAITGPAIIAEHTATSVIQEGDYLRVGEFGEMIINLKKGDE